MNSAKMFNVYLDQDDRMSFSDILPVQPKPADPVSCILCARIVLSPDQSFSITTMYCKKSYRSNLLRSLVAIVECEPFEDMAKYLQKALSGILLVGERSDNQTYFGGITARMLDEHSVFYNIGDGCFRKLTNTDPIDSPLIKRLSELFDFHSDENGRTCFVPDSIDLMRMRFA